MRAILFCCLGISSIVNQIVWITSSGNTVEKIQPWYVVAEEREYGN